MRKVKILDSIMGSGKTSYAIQEMNDIKNIYKRYIYITPYLDEVKRIKEQVTNRKFYEPNEKLGSGSKLNHFKKLISEGRDIVATHMLFSYIDMETELLLKDKDYVLVLDEVFKVIEKLNIKQDDMKFIKDYIIIEDDGKVVWNYPNYKGDRIIDIKRYCDTESLYSYDGEFFFWTFPARIFDLFSDTFILTYLFSCQIQAYYYEMFGIEFEYNSVRFNNGSYELCEYNKSLEDRNSIKSLINIYIRVK